MKSNRQARKLLNLDRWISSQFRVNAGEEVPTRKGSGKNKPA